MPSGDDASHDETDDAIFIALADSTRRRLLTTLAERSPTTATQLTREFPLTRQGISKHLDLLAGAGLVRMQTRGREKRYWLSPRPLSEVSDWVDAVNLKWAERMRRLKRLVESDEAG